ncbi:hypothetical protein M5K25_025792 [Dendrobium thyrsiflorum]|uniref:Uncharacterized protein n=1 Tax=Dendrobium thyrsiflorum TaxID=117978 RepID=A0ABD0U585_DENTH
MDGLTDDMFSHARLDILIRLRLDVSSRRARAHAHRLTHQMRHGGAATAIFQSSKKEKEVDKASGSCFFFLTEPETRVNDGQNPFLQSTDDNRKGTVVRETHSTEAENEKERGEGTASTPMFHFLLPILPNREDQGYMQARAKTNWEESKRGFAICVSSSEVKGIDNVCMHNLQMDRLMNCKLQRNYLFIHYYFSSIISLITKSWMDGYHHQLCKDEESSPSYIGASHISPYHAVQIIPLHERCSSTDHHLLDPTLLDN